MTFSRYHTLYRHKQEHLAVIRQEMRKTDSEDLIVALEQRAFNIVLR